MDGIKQAGRPWLALSLLWSLLCLGMVAHPVVVLAAEVASAPAAVKAPAAKKAPVKAKASKKVNAVVPAPAPVTADGEAVYAIVNGRFITAREYREALSIKMRTTFYHGKIPEGQGEVVRQEVSDKLVENALLGVEAERRGVRADTAKIEKVVADYDTRYGAEPAWAEAREKFLREVRAEVARQSMIEQMEKAVRAVPQPTSAEAQAYYEQKPELFTEPERLSLSIILLAVDPGASEEALQQAFEQAREIASRIKIPADFAKEARLHSKHASAGNGGDMGYQHGGMMPEVLEGSIDNLEMGVVSVPLRMLEGVALFRLDKRVPANLREFAAVEKRARELLIREWGDQAWRDTISRLRASAKIEILSPATEGGN